MRTSRAPRFGRMAVLALALAVTSAHAVKLCLDRPIRFSHYEFGLLHSNGRGGIDDDVLLELERRTGCKFAVDTRARARIWLELESGSLDMAGSGVQNRQRDNFAWFAHYVVEDNQVHLGTKVAASLASTSAFVKQGQLMLGGVRSYSYSPAYDQWVEKLTTQKRFVGTVDPEMLFRMFDAGRFDAFIASPFLSLHFFKTLKRTPPQHIVDWDPGPPTPSGLVLSKKSFSAEQGAAWQALVAELIRDGTVRKILVRHMGERMAPMSEFAPPKPAR